MSTVAARDIARIAWSVHPLARPVARGKFLYAKDTKLYVRGVTYGTFALDSSGREVHSRAVPRAFLKDAPIILLDEPTSALDLASEAAIVNAMDRLMANRTVFLIAHRPSTLARCDVRLELRDGNLSACEPAGTSFTA